MTWSSIESIIGASLIGPTATENWVVSDNSPSDTITVITEKPCQSSMGVTVMVLSFESAVTRTSKVSEYANKVRTSPVSISVSSKANTPILSSSMTWSSIGSIIGASFVGAIVTLKFVVSDSSPSETTTAISDWPWKSEVKISIEELDIDAVVVTSSLSEKEVTVKSSLSTS